MFLDFSLDLIGYLIRKLQIDTCLLSKLTVALTGKKSPEKIHQTTKHSQSSHIIWRKFRTATLQTVISYERRYEGNHQGFPIRISLSPRRRDSGNSYFPESSVYGTTRAVDRLCHARETWCKLDCHVPVRVITGCKASRNVCPGKANFIWFEHNRRGPQPILHRVLPRLYVTRSCPTNVLHRHFLNVLWVHCPRQKVGSRNIHLCSNSSDTGTRLFDAGIHASAFLRAVSLQTCWLEKPALTHPNCMSELIKDMLPESHHVCVHFSAKVKELCFNPGGLPRIWP